MVSDLNKNFVGSTDLAKKRHGSADLHTPSHPPLLCLLWSVMRLIFKTSSVIPDFFYIFNIMLSFSTCSQSFKKICTWEILGAKVLNLEIWRYFGYYTKNGRLIPTAKRGKEIKQP